MKIILVTLSILLSCSSCMGGHRFRKAKFTMKVIDSQTNQPVTNGFVQTVFRHGYGAFPDDPRWVLKVPLNKDGIAVLSTKSDLWHANGSIKVKGYYPGGAGFEFKGQNKILNRWEPWNPTLEVKLRPIKNPVPMVHKDLVLKAPILEKPVGLDLEVGDWVAPYGKGKITDFTVMFNLLTPKEKGIHYFLTFPNPDDGIQEYEFSKEMHSYFKWPYLAPLSGYQSSLDKYFVLNFPKILNAPKYNLKKNINYIFRVRTQRNKKKEIVSAYYGRIKREVRISPNQKFRLEYWLNTNSTSRSLEWIGNVPQDQRKNYK